MNWSSKGSRVISLVFSLNGPGNGGKKLEDRFAEWTALSRGRETMERNGYGLKGQCMTENRWRRKERETQTEVPDYQAEGGSSRDCQ